MSIPDRQQAFQKAMVMNAPGTPLEKRERPVDKPEPGQVLVKVEASSLNFHDNVNLMGLLPGPWPRVPATSALTQRARLAESAARCKKVA